MADISALFRNPALAYNPSPITAPSLESLSGVTGTGNPSLQAPMQAPKKPGAFGKGGEGWKILGIIGDALQTAGGGKATYAPMMMDLQERIDAERKWQTQLAQQSELKRQELAAKANDHGDDPFTRALLAAGIQPGTPEYIALARKRAEMLTNPVQLVDNGMGGKIAVRPNETGGLPQGYDPNEWEVVGGPTQPASGGF